MGILLDLLKALVPFAWAIFCFVGFIGYLAIPDDPRVNAAVAYLISMVLSIALLIHIWRYHRSTSGMQIFEKTNQDSVNGKLIVLIIVGIAMYITSIVYWVENGTKIADAIGYTGSWIICMILIADLYILHQGTENTVFQEL